MKHKAKMIPNRDEIFLTILMEMPDFMTPANMLVQHKSNNAETTCQMLSLQSKLGVIDDHCTVVMNNVDILSLRKR